jgi:hypothetical protein
MPEQGIQGAIVADRAAHGRRIRNFSGFWPFPRALSLVAGLANGPARRDAPLMADRAPSPTGDQRSGMAVPLVAFAAGAAVAMLLGVFGRVHDPTTDGTFTLGFHTVIQMKVVVTTAVGVLVLLQGLGALVLYGKLPVRAPSWLGTAHRASGATALVLAVIVAYHCLWALGLEYGHLSDGEEVGGRTVVHGVLGCLVFGAAETKVAAVRARRAPGWFLPVAGALLFTLFVGVVLTSAVWYYANYGLPDSNGY